MSPRRSFPLRLPWAALLCLAVLIGVLPACGDAASPPSPLASPGHRLTAFVFLSTECPLSQNYTLPLNELRDQYPPADLDLVGVFPLADDDAARVDGFRSTYGVRFATRLDHGYALVDALEASITPEVVLLDARDQVIYRGKIDNWAVKLGTTRKAATEHYLRDAIEAHLAGRTPEVERVDPIGCFLPEEPYLAANE